MPECHIRHMRREEIDTCIELAAREGWNPGLHDAAAFHATDPAGFLMAEVDGQFAGCISAVSYAGSFGFIGLYIVQPAWRGQGIGRQLWQAGLQRLSGHVIGLDGVVAQQENYRQQGFELAWNNARFAGVAAAATAVESTDILPLFCVDLALLSWEDRRVFPAPREAFLSAWREMPDAHSLALVHDGVLHGWGTIRPCREGSKIGPLVADSADAAQTLFRALCARVPVGSPVFIDVPLTNGEAVLLAETHGMRAVFETARMYKGEVPPCEIGRQFGIATFELG